jgi:magnesium transporter
MPGPSAVPFQDPKESTMSISRFYHVTRAGKIVRMPTLAKALAAVRRGGFVWLDYCQPTKDDLSVLMKPLGIHALAIDDCLDDNQIPKVDIYPRHTFFLFNAFHHSRRTLSITEVDAFIGKNFLVTVSGLDPEGKPVLDHAERTVKLDLENARQGPAFLLHILLDRIVDQKFTAIEALEEEIDTSEETILADLSHFNPADLLHLRRGLLDLRKSLFHEREILVKICRRDCPFIPDKAIFFYRDIYDHLAKFFELTESSRDVVTSLMEMYLSMLNNQMTKAANETNVTVRRLTFITTIFMPLTLLAGIGGMSEWSMMTGPENWRISYPIFLAAMALIGIGNLYLLKRFEKKNRIKKRKSKSRVRKNPR